jgi:hypothetical protein
MSTISDSAVANRVMTRQKMRMQQFTRQAREMNQFNKAGYTCSLTIIKTFEADKLLFCRKILPPESALYLRNSCNSPDSALKKPPIK